VETNYSHVLQAETVRGAQPGLLLRTAHAIYHAQFRRWFGIMAPASLLAGFVLVLADLQLKAITRGIRGKIPPPLADIAALGGVRFGSFFLSWLLGCFALAAIATVVNNLEHGETESWGPDSYQLARSHIGGVVQFALITFCAFIIGMLGVEFIGVALGHSLRGVQFSRFNYGWSILSYVLVASIVAWLGTALPLLLKDNLRIGSALKKSVALSNGYEGALLLLVLESVLGSMLAWYAVVHGLPRFFSPQMTYTAWYGWLLNVVGVLASAAIESPLFIGLSLLADPDLFNGSTVSLADQMT
jgi:hypothetical protein